MFHVYELEAQGLFNYVIDSKPYKCKITQLSSYPTKEEALVWRDTKARMRGGLWYRRVQCGLRYYEHPRFYQWEIARDMGISVNALKKLLKRARVWLYPWPEWLEEWVDGRLVQQPEFYKGYVI